MKLWGKILMAALPAVLLLSFPYSAEDLTKDEVLGDWKHEEAGTNFDTWQSGYYEQ